MRKGEAHLIEKMKLENALELKASLEDILDILRIDIHLSLVLKQNLPRVYFRFDEFFSSLIFELFNYYRIVCNVFENSILLKQSPKEFETAIKCCFTSFSTFEEKAKEAFDNESAFNLLKELSLFLCNLQYQELIRIVEKSYTNGDRKFYIAEGKENLLSVYLSIISIIHGLRNIRENNHCIFYYQPFYNKIRNFFHFMTVKSTQLLDKKINFILSYRYCNRDYTIFEGNINIDVTYIQSIIRLVKHFDTFYIASFDNSNLSLDYFPEDIRKRVHILISNESLAAEAV